MHAKFDRLLALLRVTAVSVAEDGKSSTSEAVVEGVLVKVSIAIPKQSIQHTTL